MIIFQEEIVAVKPRQYCFRAEILPSQLICAYFEMQNEKSTSLVGHRPDLDSHLFGQEIYLSVS